MRLVTFGCSLTEGSFLPVNTAWPYVVAERLNIPVVNMGLSGSSNNRILYDILNFDYIESDIVVVLWTYINREMLVHSDGSVDNLGPWKESDWLRYSDSYDYSIKSIMNVYHAKLHLGNLKQIHIKADNSKELPLAMTNTKYIKKIFDFDASIIDVPDYASDNSHPGPLSHMLLATTISDLIQEKFL